MSRRTHQDLHREEDEDQAEEVRGELQELQNQQISQEEGEDLEEDAERDYLPIRELDIYEDQGVDDDVLSLNPEARRLAQQELQKRDKLYHQEMDEVDDYFDEDQMRWKNIRQYEDEQVDDIDENKFIDQQDIRQSIDEWILKDDAKNYIKFKFQKFLKRYTGKAQQEKLPQYRIQIYKEKIFKMCIQNVNYIEIDFAQLKQACPFLSYVLGHKAKQTIEIMNDILHRLALRSYPSHRHNHSTSSVKFYNLSIIDKIRDLRKEIIGKLIKIRGVVTIRSELYYELYKIEYKCRKCGKQKGPFYLNHGIKKQTIVQQLGLCSSCQSSYAYAINKMNTVYKNYQTIHIQELSSEVLPGRVPRNKQVILFGSDVDKVKPGQEVEVTGALINRFQMNLNIKNGFPLFKTLVQCNRVVRLMEDQCQNINQDLEKQFLGWSKDPKISRKIYESIAPSIYGHYQVKKALTFAMFGGVEKDFKHKVRGDINILLLGDPGVAKSQFLKSVQKVFYRCIYTTGKGASAVGLTASVKQDNISGEWRLEAGALVLADKGICLIDEFDKMNEADRTSIHEAMEQQTISICKATINTTLKARCAVIAAANPVKGTYDSTLSFQDNIELSDPILSRFDILNVIKDQPRVQQDYNLATFIINSHIENHPYSEFMRQQTEKNKLQSREVEPLPIFQVQKLKLYIKYAKMKCKPKMTDKCNDIIKSFYIKIRQQSQKHGGMRIAPRHLQSIIRISEAHAKIHLRNQVSYQDAVTGIRTMLISFLQTQKAGVAKQIKRNFHGYL